MPEELLGQAAALSAAIVWALAVVLLKVSGETMPPVVLNLFKNGVGLVLLGLTMALLGQGRELLAMTASDLWILALSGFLGIALADTLFLYALNIVGVGVSAITEASYSPFALLFAWILLSEELGPSHFAGAGLVLIAVVVIARAPPPPGRSTGQILAGVLAGATAMALMAFGIVFAKPVLERTPLLLATTIRLGVGTLALALLWSLTPGRRQLAQLLRPTARWRHLLPAAVLSTYVALLLWTAGFKYADAGIAAILNQTSMVFALLFSSLFLGEPFTRRRGLALALAFGGILVVTLQPI